ncbi:MAG: 3-methyl-2-oxobutanoate hydroxymethyltransferase [Thaumarchaeota archaeon]|nr:3-methyl-2-oxobutanoate hydroxymethyltransferase [Nitrososphaerota archaeon]|tara:strand:+ start:1841 stop:2707 length:867 start_codon:yes stop_codon:yes gene_type:complete
MEGYKAKVTVDEIVSMKKKSKITMLTAYDFTTATICDKAGVDVLLVGDSAGMVMLGYNTTTPVTIDEMMLFCKAVVRGSRHAMVVADMPFMSYQVDVTEAVRNACIFVKEAGVDAVKIEGGEEMVDTIRAIVRAGIPVMGHIGLKPQTAMLWQGYKVQGKCKESALQLVRDAKAIEKAGVYCIVLEKVVVEVAKIITDMVKVPTIGIGAGNVCDGQVLVIHDLLGLYEQMKPKFVKRYAELAQKMTKALISFKNDVMSERFPSDENVFHMDTNEHDKLMKELGDIKNE